MLMHNALLIKDVEKIINRSGKHLRILGKIRKKKSLIRTRKRQLKFLVYVRRKKVLKYLTLIEYSKVKRWRRKHWITHLISRTLWPTSSPPWRDRVYKRRKYMWYYWLKINKPEIWIKNLFFSFFFTTVQQILGPIAKRGRVLTCSIVLAS